VFDQRRLLGTSHSKPLTATIWQPRTLVRFPTKQNRERTCASLGLLRVSRSHVQVVQPYQLQVAFSEPALDRAVS
jgi:hypothetical protein